MGGAETLTAPAEQKESHLYAQWAAGYTLIYDANGGEGTPAITQNAGEKVSGSVVTAESNANTYSFTNLAKQGQMTGPKEADDTADHRIFLGWSTNKNATEPEYTNDGNLAYDNTSNDYDKTKTSGFGEQVGIDSFTNESRTVTLYAVWATKYELSFKYHPEMADPKCGDENKLQKPITLVSAENKAPTFTLISQADADAAEYTPTREEGYRWGWWGDNLERFKFNKPGEGQSAAQAGNEGCYQFGEPVPARTSGDTSKAPNWDNPTLTLYAYFQPPSACSLIFDDNTSNTRQFPQREDRNNTYKVSKMPDNAGASTTEITWNKQIPGGEDNTPIHPRYKFVGWSEDKDSTDPEYQPGDTVSVNKVIKNKITLYAIWKPMHNFRLTFNYNGGGRIYYKGTNGNWTYTTSSTRYADSNTSTTNSGTSTYFADTTYTYPATFFEANGLFATRKDDTVGEYKFLGWSWTQQSPNTDENQLTVDFPVDMPTIKESANESNQGLEPNDPTGDQGIIKKAVTVTEETPCTAPATHNTTLYAVWRKSPKHQLKVTFNKGEASTTTGELNHYIDINGVRQSSTRYYAALDYPSYTWNADYWASNTPSASKEDEKDDTATYTFIGWTTKEEQKTPSATITKNDIDYPVDDNGKITKAIKVSETADTAAECAGGIHEVKLWPVFKKNPRHVYELTYDANVPSTAEGIENKVYRLVDGNWVEQKDGSGKNITSDVYDRQIKELSETNYEWDLSGAGLFASCVNTSSTPTGEYTFLGWSYTKYDIRNNPYKPGEGPAIEFPITAPSDPENPGSGEGVFGQGSKIKIDTDEQDPKPDDACTDETGRVHPKPLYGVWTGEPLHQYSIIFTGVEKDTSIIYGSKADWAADPNTTKSESVTIGKTRKNADNQNVPVKYYDIDNETENNLAADVKYAYRVFTDPLPMPKTDPDKTDSFVFNASFWNDDSDPENVKDLIVKAERKADSTTRYVFDGWYTKPGGQGTKVDVDSDGYITSPFTVKDTDYDNCDSDTHNLILYAKWKDVKIHNFQLIFSNIDANDLGYYDNGTWKNASYKTIYKTGTSGIINYLVEPAQADFLPSSFRGIDNSTEKFDAEESDKKLSYSWGESGDSGEKPRAMASKNKDNNAEYEFLGWSKTKKLPSESYTSADVDYHVDANGYVQEKIEIDDPDIDSSDTDSACSHSTHTLVLYPVFKRIPIHNFSVTMNLNGGSGLRQYNESSGSWSNRSSNSNVLYKPEGTSSSVKVKTSESSNTYTWETSDFWSKNGFGAYKNYDSYYTYELVGWSTKQIAISDNPDTSTDMVAWTKAGTEYAGSDTAHMTPYVNGFINQDITVNCSENPCTGGNHNVTLYAVWKRTPRVKTYTLKFDANGGENAPADITKTTTYDAGSASAWNSSDFTLTNQQIQDAGMKNRKLVFVGWHENANADQGKYGEKNSANEELEALTQNLTNPYTITNTAASTTLSAYTVEKTLYAIWWYEYQLDYDANGGSGAPEHEHVYTSDTSYNFRISNDKPTHSSGYEFLGWSENQVTPGQGASSDVQYASSTDAEETRYPVNVDKSPDDEEYGYTGKRLYAVWGPAN